MVRATRAAMATATRVAGDEEDEGVEDFILNWNKMFERRGWRATKRARAMAARATVASATATRARDGDNLGDGDGDEGGG